jgi:ABC-type glycerol-3-phosphate transport system substrate-binding protein
LAGAATVGAAALAACGGAGGAATAPAGPVKGKVLFWQESTSDLAKQLWASMQATFKEAQPNVELQFDTTPVPAGQSRDDKLFATLSSGSAWDVWQRDIPPSYQQPLVDKKAVLALDEYYASQPQYSATGVITGNFKHSSQTLSGAWQLGSPDQPVTDAYPTAPSYTVA